MPLTNTAVLNAKPEAKQRKLADGKGLFRLVHPNGSKYWRLKYRFGGRKNSWRWVYTPMFLLLMPGNAEMMPASCWQIMSTPPKTRKLLGPRVVRKLLTALREVPAVIEFGASWCGYCRAAQPLIASALSDYPSVRHIKIEDGKGRQPGRSFRVTLWPTLVFLSHGKEVTRLVRPDDADEIREALALIDDTPRQ